MAEYYKSTVARIIRTEHRVILWPNVYATDIKKALGQVPLNAKLVEIECGEGTQIILKFVDEAEDAKE